MKLTAQNGTGKSVNKPLPTLKAQVFFDKKISLLAVIFEVKKLPDVAFYPNFTAKNPDDMPALRQDFLWENHCYELFLGFEKAENSPYVEINFSPNGAFNLYHFDRYRTPQQMPPRRLNVAENEQQRLLNVYQVASDNSSPVFWQNSTFHQQAMQAVIEENFPLTQGNHRLVMMVDLMVLAKLLKMEKMNEIWQNPCAVFKGEKETVYFAHQHANPPDFHDKKCWLEMKC